MPSRPAWLRQASFCLVLVGFAAFACARARSTTAATSTGPKIAITGASVNGSNEVVVSYTLTKDGQPLTGDAATSMQPNWTLAGLTTDPVTRDLPPGTENGQILPPIPAWFSYVATGSETLASLPIDGPGTPDAFVLQNARQPGSETGGATEDLGNGGFRYTFSTQLPQGFDPTQTLRVGVWLAGTPGTSQTTSTFDFVPSGGAVQTRELVLDANCNRCHGTIQAHGGFRTGTKICLTCHTYQNADADTVDPAAPLDATPATNPNPLDLGRLVHRIHRGKDLPTLYLANLTVSDPNQPNVALPFDPARNAPVAGRKYSVVGFQSREAVYGQVADRTANGQTAAAVATGVRFPQDLRNCDACHGGAPQADDRVQNISRRTCQGCHADVWFQDSTPDLAHFAHTAGPQTDDSTCLDCHVPTADFPDVDADVTAIHVAPVNSPNHSGIDAQIVSVQNLKPGQKPTVVFTLSDRNGFLSPLNAPTPAADSASPVPRALDRVAITISGPTSPDYLTGNFASSTTAPVTESVPLSTAADASGQFSYTFAAAVPNDATGTWAVGLEARRRLGATPQSTWAVDAGNNTFAWPSTGEALTETSDNPVMYVDVAAGSAPGGNPTPRRQVVSRDNCNACHLQLSVHGDLRHNTEYCVLCHAPDATDWSQRPKANGNTNLAGTFDGIEERSIQLKTLVHRIHTGGRTGSAELDLGRPFTVYGFGGSVNFFDDVRFPNNLANCTLCHQNGSYTPESVPADALPTVANETATIQHQGSATHGPSEPVTPPIQAACLACHDTGAAQFHAQQNTIAGKEQCLACHSANAFMSVNTVHGLPSR